MGIEEFIKLIIVLVILTGICNFLWSVADTVVNGRVRPTDIYGDTRFYYYFYKLVPFITLCLAMVLLIFFN